MAESASSTCLKNYAVIINNFNDEFGGNIRQGGENDDKYLDFVFVKNLGFDRLNESEELKRNLTLEKWKCGRVCSKECIKCIQCLIKASDLKNCKSFLFAVCSHGKTDENGLQIQFADEFLYLHEIISFLKGCKSLEGKTVIIVVEACRSVTGTLDDAGVPVRVADAGAGDQAGSTTTTTVLSPEETFNTSTDVPKGFMILFSTTPYRYAYRNQSAVGSVPQGSWFVTGMKEVIEEKNKDETVNLLDFFTDVARIVARRSAIGSKANVDPFTGCTEGGKCVPCLEHRITQETDIEYTMK